MANKYMLTTNYDKQNVSLFRHKLLVETKINPNLVDFPKFFNKQTREPTKHLEPE